MNFNQRNDYKVSRELAHNWWKAIPADRFLVRVPDAHNKPIEPENADKPGGPWIILTPQNTDVAGVVAQALTDGSDQWGLAVLWYDKGQCSWLARTFRAAKLSRSKVAAAQIGEIVLRQGGRVFPTSASTRRQT
jgi:hypothetical protein